MANRTFVQFVYSFFKKPVFLAGHATWNSAVAASLVVQDLTYTAAVAGEAGNLVSIVYIAGGTAGSEVVTVLGNQIEIEIEDGVSTATEVKTAFDLVAGALALATVAVSGTAGDAQVAAVEAFLAGGEDNEFQAMSFHGVSSIAVNSAGDYTVNLSDKYSKLLGFSASILSTTSQDRIWQIDSNAVATRALGLRSLVAATPTYLVDGSIVHFEILLSSSSAD